MTTVVMNKSMSSTNNRQRFNLVSFQKLGNHEKNSVPRWVLMAAAILVVVLCSSGVALVIFWQDMRTSVQNAVRQIASCSEHMQNSADYQAQHSKERAFDEANRLSAAQMLEMAHVDNMKFHCRKFTVAEIVDHERPPGSIRLVRACFALYGARMLTQEIAAQFCKQRFGATLPYFEYPEIYAHFKDNFYGAQRLNYPIWLDYTRANVSNRAKPWVFQRSDQRFPIASFGLMEYSKEFDWEPGKLDNWNGSEGCVHLKPNRKMNDISCSSWNRVVCMTYNDLWVYGQH